MLSPYRQLRKHPEAPVLAELILRYLNPDEAFKYYTEYPDIIEQPSILKRLAENGGVRYFPTYRRLMIHYDRQKPTVRSYGYDNRSPEAIFKAAALENNLEVMKEGLRLFKRFDQQTYDDTLRDLLRTHKAEMSTVELLLDCGTTLSENHVSLMAEHYFKDDYNVEMLKLLLKDSKIWKDEWWTSRQLISAARRKNLNIFLWLADKNKKATADSALLLNVILFGLPEMREKLFSYFEPREAVRVRRMKTEELLEHFGFNSRVYEKVLEYAAKSNNLAAAKLILSLGIPEEEEHEDEDGLGEAMHNAAQTGSVAMINLLKLHDASVDRPTVLIAIKHGHYDLSVELAEELKKTNVYEFREALRQQEYYDGFLGAAIKSEKPEMVKLVLSWGASAGTIELEEALELDNINIFRLLVDLEKPVGDVVVLSIRKNSLEAFKFLLPYLDTENLPILRMVAYVMVEECRTPFLRALVGYYPATKDVIWSVFEDWSDRNRAGMAMTINGSGLIEFLYELFPEKGDKLMHRAIALDDYEGIYYLLGLGFSARPYLEEVKRRDTALLLFYYMGELEAVREELVETLPSLKELLD